MAVQQGSGYSVRECARSIIAAIAKHGDDTAALGEALKGPISRLTELPGLLDQGVPRLANHVAMSKYLYFDGEMSMLLFEVPKGQSVQPHDHGVWETLSIYRGAVRHTVYSRTDDGAVDGRARLDVLDDRVLKQGDFAIVAPPDDIHGFTSLEDGTLGITVVAGPYKHLRHYYDPAAGTCVVRQQRNAR